MTPEEIQEAADLLEQRKDLAHAQAHHLKEIAGPSGLVAVFAGKWSPDTNTKYRFGSLRWDVLEKAVRDRINEIDARLIDLGVDIT